MDDKKQFSRRLLAIGVLFSLVLAAYFVTLFDAQIVHGAEYRARSIRANTKSETVVTSRGILTDRNGKALVTNRSVYTLELDTSLTPSDDAALNKELLRLIELLENRGIVWEDTLPLTAGAPFAYDFSVSGSHTALNSYLVSKKWADEDALTTDTDPPLSPEALLSRLRTEFKVDEDLTDAEARKLVGLRYCLAVTKLNQLSTAAIASDISVELIAELKDGAYAPIHIGTSSVREYQTDAAAHILGRVTKIPRERGNEYKEKGYAMNAYVGYDGVELAFEDYLRGRNGRRIVETNTAGKVTGEIYSVEPEPGNTVALTLDIDFQEDVERILAETVESMTAEDDIDRGAAAAVVQVGTGEVPSLASYPTYSLSTFRENISELSNDSMRPMWNRATQGKYAPGSTLKPLTGIAALESGATTVREKIYDSGKWVYPGYSASYTYCWKRSGHGALNVRGAIMNSCNYYFAEMGYRMGMDTLRKYYADFGLGAPTGIEIGDTAGRLPSQNEGENLAPWAAFGQANQEYSPLQLANYIATLCGGGERYATHLLKNVRSSGSGTLEYVYDAEPVETISMSSENLSAVLAGMHDLAADGAVSSYFKDCIVDAAAKTGTIQTGDAKNNNGAFVCFAPYDDPQIAVAIVIEKGGTGAALASTAVQVLNAYFSNASASSAVTGENTLLG